MSKDRVQSVAGQYGRHGLAERIMTATRLAFPDGAASDDLGDFDQFHPGGRAATEALAAAADPKRGSIVLDVGAGLGGAARWLATHLDCHVTCLDLTPEYCEAAEALTDFTGLALLVEVHQGDARQTPFDDCSFDLVWAQNAFMNIEDKASLFHELHRVLKPGGKLAFMEVMAGPAGEPVKGPNSARSRKEDRVVQWRAVARRRLLSR